MRPAEIEKKYTKKNWPVKGQKIAFVEDVEGNNTTRVFDCGCIFTSGGSAWATNYCHAHQWESER